jgi:hypothetical protein
VTVERIEAASRRKKSEAVHYCEWEGVPSRYDYNVMDNLASVTDPNSKRYALRLRRLPAHDRQDSAGHECDNVCLRPCGKSHLEPMAAAR